MPFGSLWLPVVVSAVVVFFASSILHMVLTYHRADYKALPGEDALRDAFSRAAPSPGVYFTPHCKDHKAINEPANKAKFEKGPVAMITVYPNGMPMLPKHLVFWFGVCLLVSFAGATIARHTLAPGVDAARAMPLTGLVALVGYGIGQLSDSIWKGQPWSNTFRHLIDALIYAVLTGLTFRLLWPAA